jgi:ferredoxin
MRPRRDHRHRRRQGQRHKGGAHGAGRARRKGPPQARFHRQVRDPRRSTPSSAPSARRSTGAALTPARWSPKEGHRRGRRHHLSDRRARHLCGRRRVTGPKFAIDAIAAGKEAAISLHRFVQPGQTLTLGRDPRHFYVRWTRRTPLIPAPASTLPPVRKPGYDRQAKAKTFKRPQRDLHRGAGQERDRPLPGLRRHQGGREPCIGCGLCTTKCKFDAIHLVKRARDWEAGKFETMPIKVAEQVVKKTGKIIKKSVSK